MKSVKSTTEQTAKRIPLFIPTHTSSQNNKAEQIYRKVALPTMEGIHFEKVEGIVSLEAKGNYTNIHFINGKKLCHDVLSKANLINLLHDALQIMPGK